MEPRPRPLGDPVRLTVTVCVALALVGFAVILVAAGRMADLRTPALQTPYIVSGGLTGFALVVFGTTGALLQLGRRRAARTTADLAHVADALDALSQKRKRLESTAAKNGRK